MDDDYFREFGIVQVYITEYLQNIYKNIFYNNYCLEEYKKKNVSSLFVGIMNEYDVNIINEHCGDIYLLLNDSDIEYINANNYINNLKENELIQYIYVVSDYYNNVLNNIKKKIIKINNSWINNSWINFPIMTILSFCECFKFMNKIIQLFLEELGWIVNIVEKKNTDLKKILEINKIFKNNYYLIFCPFQIQTYFYDETNNYIIYQFEQYNSDMLSVHYEKMFKDGSIKKCNDNARLLIDYTKINTKKIKDLMGYEPYYLPTPIKYNKIDIDETEKIYDIVFIGSINQRRKNILNNLKKKYKICIPKTFIYEEELYNLYKKTKLLLNIHYFSNPILERPRINEALLSGIRIISEKPCIDDIDVCDDYKDVVDFIEIIEKNDTTELEKCIIKVLDELKNEKICEKRNVLLNQTVQKLESEFKNRLYDIFNINKFIQNY